MPLPLGLRLRQLPLPAKSFAPVLRAEPLVVLAPQPLEQPRSGAEEAAAMLLLLLLLLGGAPRSRQEQQPPPTLRATAAKQHGTLRQTRQTARLPTKLPDIYQHGAARRGGDQDVRDGHWPPAQILFCLCGLLRASPPPGHFKARGPRYCTPSKPTLL